MRRGADAVRRTHGRWRSSLHQRAWRGAAHHGLAAVIPLHPVALARYPWRTVLGSLASLLALVVAGAAIVMTVRTAHDLAIDIIPRCPWW